MKRAKIVLNPHDCEICKKPIVKRQTESKYSYNARLTCSRECQNILRSRCIQNRVDPEPHNCKICDAPLTMRPGENAPAFNARKTCSETCADVLRGITNKKNKGKKQPRWHQVNDPQHDERMRRLSAAQSIASSLAGSFRK